MQDGSSGSLSPVPPPPADAKPTRRAGGMRNALGATTRSQQPGRRTGDRRMAIHPLWLALGAATLFGVIFGIGALANGNFPSAAPSGADIETITIHVIQQVDPSVAQVQARGASGNGVGSGEILTTSGYIVTNDHVVHGFSTLTVLLADGRQVAARLVGEAPREDLAVLKISAPNLRPITVGDSSRVQVGEYALAIGSPLGLEQSATSGIVSALNRQANAVIGGSTITLTGMIQTSAPINPGNSGGALVNLRGQLIGIPTLGAVEPSSGVAANGIGFAISSNRMEAIVRQLTGGAA